MVVPVFVIHICTGTILEQSSDVSYSRNNDDVASYVSNENVSSKSNNAVITYTWFLVHKNRDVLSTRNMIKQTIWKHKPPLRAVWGVWNNKYQTNFNLIMNVSICRNQRRQRPLKYVGWNYSYCSSRCRWSWLRSYCTCFVVSIKFTLPVKCYQKERHY